MRVLAPGLCCTLVIAGACGGAIAPNTTDAGSGSSPDASTTTGSSSGFSGSSSGSSGSSSGGIVDATTTGCAQGPPLMVTPDCNQCVSDFCEDTWCYCAGDSHDDAGEGVGIGCAGYVNCVFVCASAANVEVCHQQCTAGYSQQVIQAGDAFIACMAHSCLSSDGCPNYG
jgi:hypothetical protein